MLVASHSVLVSNLSLQTITSEFDAIDLVWFLCLMAYQSSWSLDSQIHPCRRKITVVLTPFDTYMPSHLGWMWYKTLYHHAPPFLVSSNKVRGPTQTKIWFDYFCLMTCQTSWDIQCQSHLSGRIEVVLFNP